MNFRLKTLRFLKLVTGLKNKKGKKGKGKKKEKKKRKGKKRKGIQVKVVFFLVKI